MVASLTSEEHQGPAYAKKPSGKTFRKKHLALSAASSVDPDWAADTPRWILTLFQVWNQCVSGMLRGLSSVLDVSAIWGRCVSTQPLQLASSLKQPGLGLCSDDGQPAWMGSWTSLPRSKPIFNLSQSVTSHKDTCPLSASVFTHTEPSDLLISIN